MFDAVNKAGVKHMMGFNYRRVPAIVLMKKLIDEGKIAGFIISELFTCRIGLLTQIFP